VTEPRITTGNLYYREAAVPWPLPARLAELQAYLDTLLLPTERAHWALYDSVWHRDSLVFWDDALWLPYSNGTRAPMWSVSSVGSQPVEATKRRLAGYVADYRQLCQDSYPQVARRTRDMAGAAAWAGRQAELDACQATWDARFCLTASMPPKDVAHAH
jgi:hypothetical protein